MDNKYIKIIIAIVTITIILLPGCSDKSNQESKKPVQQSSQKPPEEYKMIVKDIESIISELSKLITMNNMPATQMESTENQSSQNNADQSQNEPSKNTKAKQTSDEKQNEKQKSWQTAKEKLKNIHKNWNMIESDAVKAGLTVSERKDFEQAIENLTQDMSQQSETEGLTSAIELYGQFGNLAKVFKSPIPADLYKCKYEIMAASAEAAMGEWDKAALRMPGLKENWNSLKVKAKVKDDQLISRSEFSMDDFETAIASQNIELLMIKAEIALANLQQLEKALSKSMNNQ